MEPLNTADVAIGWALITATALALIVGVPYLLKLLVRGISEASEANRLQRERHQEELDEQLRQEMLA